MSDQELAKAIADYKEAKEANSRLKLSDIQAVQRQFKKTCDTTKRETQLLDMQQKAPGGGRTRSGIVRAAVNRAVYSDGRFVNKGIDDSQDKFDDEEKEFLSRAIARVKNVCDLKYPHIKYLVVDVYLDELRAIQDGRIESKFHREYMKRDGSSKMDLLSEIRSSLFTNEQRDYISGLLQGAFQTTATNENGDIKHDEISYVEIVMLAECIIRIVKHVHKFKTNKETQEFMIQSSLETLGISP